MIYDVRQTTTYVYETAVTRARHVLRLLPVARPGLHVTAAMLDIDPVPVSRREAADFFRNWTTVTEIEEPHETLTVKLAARGTVGPAGSARSGPPRLRARKLSAGPPCVRGRPGTDAPHQGRFHLPAGRHHGDDDAVG